MTKGLAVVAGGGGFIGGHLVGDLLGQGYAVRSVDVKPLEEWYQVYPRRGECRRRPEPHRAVPPRLREGRTGLPTRRGHGRDGLHREQQGAVHALGADQYAHAAWPPEDAGVERFFYSLVRLRLQRRQAARRRMSSPLKEEDAYPAMPEDGYGWEKLFSASGCAATSARISDWKRASRDFTTSMARIGTWEGGREKAPAAICRKVIDAKHTRQARDRDLGRRPPDAQLHVYRRLH